MISRPAPGELKERERVRAAWAAEPWWKRIFRSPKPHVVTLDYEPLHGSYQTLAEADVAAQQAADKLPDPMNAEVGVSILDSEGTEVGGHWSGGGGNF